MSMCSIAVPWMNNTHWSRSIDDSMNSDNFLSDYSFSLSFVNWMNASLLHRHVSSLFLSTSDYITNHLQSGLGKHQVSTGATVGVYSSAPYNDRLVVRVCQSLCTLWSHCNIIFHLCGYWAAVWLHQSDGPYTGPIWRRVDRVKGREEFQDTKLTSRQMHRYTIHYW